MLERHVLGFAFTAGAHAVLTVRTRRDFPSFAAARTSPWFDFLSGVGGAFDGDTSDELTVRMTDCFHRETDYSVSAWMPVCTLVSDQRLVYVFGTELPYSKLQQCETQMTAVRRIADLKLVSSLVRVHPVLRLMMSIWTFPGMRFPFELHVDDPTVLEGVY